MKTHHSTHCQTSPRPHPERHAAAWETLPREQRMQLLRRAGVPAKWTAACAESRWAFLPADVCNQLEQLLPPATVAQAERILQGRDLDARTESA